ncbi:MAG: Ig-like domain-containing protein, partial [Oscillospiraceae bacterium]|nr:Ig-like domain-containing protein [Oscillospiraceae bacterium]
SNDTATVSDDGNATKSVRAAGTSDMDLVQIVGATESCHVEKFENNVAVSKTISLPNNVKKIEIYISTQNVNSGSNGYLKINNGVVLPGSNDVNNKWTTGTIYEYSSLDLNIYNFEFGVWWSDKPISGEIRFYYEAPTFGITSGNITISELESGTLTANKPATWAVKDNSTGVTLTPSTDGMSCIVTPTSGFYGTVTVQATDNADASNTVEATVQVNAVTPVVDSIRVRPYGTATITVTPSTGIITYGAVADPTIATIAGNTITGRAAGNTTVSVTRNGISVDVPIAVIDGMSIQGIPVMGLKKTQQLQVEGAIGTVTWESSNPAILTIDNEGNVTSNTQTGEVTITATDSSGESANFDISVQVIAETPELPEDQEFVTDITLNKDGSWSKALNLPLTDENGRTYYYYIVEVDKNGNPAETIQGSGAKYIPISYENNASSLNEGSSVVMTVVNKLSEKSESYELPSTGGIGTRWYTISGLLVLGGGCGGFATTHLIRRFRKRKCTK